MVNELMELDVIPVQKIKDRVQAIKTLLNEVMIESTEDNPHGHYGKIPGCGDKPCLLKAGAEKIALLFNLDLQTETDIVELAGGHREYRCITNVYSATSGVRLGNGAGSATTMETKWRYRSEATGEEVTKEYWETRDSSLLGGSEFTFRKVWVDKKQKWMIFHKVEHDNPADYYNTCQKMGEKRSRVGAVLNVTGASDLFSQEDDLPEKEGDKADGKKPSVKKTASKSKGGEGKPKGNAVEVKTTIGKITTRIGKFPHKILGEKDVVFTTYSDTVADDAQQALDSGMMVIITHKGDQYNTIEKIELIEPSE